MSKENRFGPTRPLNPLETRHHGQPQQPEFFLNADRTTKEENSISPSGELIIFRNPDRAELFSTGPIVLNGVVDVYDAKISEITPQQGKKTKIKLTNITKRPPDPARSKGKEK